MSDIAITLILTGCLIFAAGYITARIIASHRRLQDRLRQALRGATKRGGRHE